jgi:DNA-binding SARP family transcriptional activator
MMSTIGPRRRARIVRLLHVVGSVAIVTVLALAPPAMPDFGPSLATPLTTSTLTRLVLLLLWIVCLALALALLQRALLPARTLKPPAWATRPDSPSRRRARELSRRDTPSPPRLVVPPRAADPAPTAIASSDQADDAARTSTDATVVATISLLGPVTIDGVKRPRRATTLELLAYLALHPDGASRDQLLEAIWPGEDPRCTRPRLWQAVSEARRLLGDAFERDGDRYKLDRARIATDVDQLDKLLAGLDSTPPADAARMVERALALWRGEPMSGTDYAWADGHIRHLEASLSKVAAAAARSRLDASDAHGALHVAEQALVIDDLNETFLRIALEAEAALGRREAMTERYETLCQRLDAQLGLEPERATRSLYRQYLSQR